MVARSKLDCGVGSEPLSMLHLLHHYRRARLGLGPRNAHAVGNDFALSHARMRALDNS